MIIFFIGYMGCGKSYVVNKLANDVKNAKVIDVKPDRDNHDKTIVVFERDEAFEKAFAELNEEVKAKEASESK